MTINQNKSFEQIIPLFQQQRYQDCIDLCINDVLINHPDFHSAYWYICSSKLALHQTDSILSYCQKLLEYYPEEISTFQILVRYYTSISDKKNVKYYTKQILKKDNENLFAIDSMVRIAEDENDKKSVKKYTELGYKLMPESRTFGVHQASYYRYYKRDYIRAKEHIDSNLERFPEDYASWNELGKIYQDQKQYKDACMAYDRAKNIFPPGSAAKSYQECLELIEKEDSKPGLVKSILSRFFK